MEDVMNAYDLGYSAHIGKRNPFSYQYQRLLFNAWKKGNQDRKNDN